MKRLKIQRHTLCNHFETMLKRVELNDSSLLYAGIRPGPRSSQNWVVLLPESGAGLMTGTASELVELVGSTVARQVHFMVVNKTGIRRSGKSPLLFEEGFRRPKRIEHALQALHQIIPPGDKIFLVGYSEGAYLAPEIAARDPRVRKIALIGGGTRGWLKEELGNADFKEKAALRKQIDRIRREPNSIRKWNGFSYATWWSYQGDETLQALRKVTVPVYAILGARDRTIDLKATLRDLQRLARSRSDVQVKVLPRCGHSFAGHWSDVQSFLEQAVSF